MRRLAALSALGLLAFSTAPLAAQPLPEGTRKAQHASQGSTEVGGQGFQAAAKEEAEESKDAATLEVAAGGMVAAGNSRQLALTGSSKARLRRGASQARGVFAVNYAEGAAAKGENVDPTVSNLQGQLRYDFFFAPHWSAFLGVTARRDRFQGLDLRLNLDPGVAYHFIEEKERALWIEAGYDFQYDVRRDENLDAARAAGEPVEKTETRHSGRGFAGYDDAFNERVKITTGIEYIQSVEALDTWRLNWDLGITSNIAGSFSTAVTLALKYDNQPLPGVEKLDAATSFNLVVSLL
jgi:putative salt-induced outer membrane protein